MASRKRWKLWFGLAVAAVALAGFLGWYATLGGGETKVEPEEKDPRWLVRYKGGVLRTESDEPDAPVLGLTFNGTIDDKTLECLKAFPDLVRLDLGDSQITDAGLAYLEKVPKVQDLDLSATRITDAGLARLKPLQDLQTLYLNKTSIGDAGLVHLEQLPKLETLYATETRVTPEGIRRLLENFPNLQVSYGRRTSP